MKSRTAYAVALVTAPNVAVARRLAAASLKAKLVACANLISQVESHYWWRGKRERSCEVLIIFKTTKAKLPSLEQFVVANHPYDTPEFIVVPITAGQRRYLKWISASVRQSSVSA